MVGSRRKSWVLRSSSKGSPFSNLADGRTNSFNIGRRSMARGVGGLNAPQVVMLVPDGAEDSFGTETSGKTGNRPKASNKWIPFPRIHIPFFSRGTKHENRAASPCRDPLDDLHQVRSRERHSMDIAALARTGAGTEPQHQCGSPQNMAWESDVQASKQMYVSHSTRQHYTQPFSPAPHRNVARPGSLDFWSSSLALAGLLPVNDANVSSFLDSCSESGFDGAQDAAGGSYPQGLGRSTSAHDFERMNQAQNMARGPSTAAGPLSPVGRERIVMVSNRQRLSSGSADNFQELQRSARQALELDPFPAAMLDVHMQAVMNEGSRMSGRHPTDHGMMTPVSGMGGGDPRLSLDSVRRPFGSMIDEQGNFLSPHASIPCTAGQDLRPIMLYSEALDASNKLQMGMNRHIMDGSYHQAFAADNQVPRPPPPPGGSGYGFGSAIYHRSLYFEQFVLKDAMPLANPSVGPPIPPVASPRIDKSEEYIDIPDYPTTVASCSNRSHLHKADQDNADMADDFEDESSAWAWLDELEERVAYRRKECTYRIACQRAFVKQMKDKLQASKLALDRLKRGLGPELSEKVLELRMRFSSRRRLKEKSNFRQWKEEDQEDLWSGPMMDFEFEVGYESDSSWVSEDAGIFS